MRHTAWIVAAMSLLALPASAGAARATAAKACSPGDSSAFVNARIQGEAECLHAGEFCRSSARSQYTRYGFTCTSVRGTFRLESRG